MANMTRQVTPTYTLTLNEEEKKYLSGILQNYGGPMAKEPLSEQKIRTELRNVLTIRETEERDY